MSTDLDTKAEKLMAETNGWLKRSICDLGGLSCCYDWVDEDGSVKLIGLRHGSREFSPTNNEIDCERWMYFVMTQPIGDSYWCIDLKRRIKPIMTTTVVVHPESSPSKEEGEALSHRVNSPLGWMWGVVKAGLAALRDGGE